MQQNPLHPVAHRFPKLDKDTTADVCIVGGGITGISTAHYLKDAGYDVIVLEQDEIGSGASGASSGILYYGSGTNFVESIKLYGGANAKLLWEETRLTIRHISTLVHKYGLQCGFRQPGALMVAKNLDEETYLAQEQNALAKIGVRTDLFPGDDLKRVFTGANFQSGLHFPEVCQIQPAQFAAELARAEELRVFENSPYVSHVKDGSNIIVRTNNATVKCSKLIFATNMRPLFGLEKHFREESSAIIASKPLTKSQMSEVWPEHKLLWTVDEKYDILYPLYDRLVLEVYSLKGHKEKLTKYYPHFEKEHVWGDSWAKTDDGLPLVGQVEPGIYVAVAMGDQGIVMGHTIGRKLPLLLEGQQDGILSMSSTDRFGK